MFLKVMIVLCLLYLLINDGSTKLISQRLKKDSWKQKGNCPSYSWKDPSSTGPDKKYISYTCNENPAPETCFIEGRWNVSKANRVLIEIETKTTSCAFLKKNLSVCHENMTVQAYKDKNILLTKKIIPKVKVPADIKYFQHKDSFYIDNLTSVNYITTKFIANRYCGELVQATVSHYECPVASGELVDFPAAPAPDKYTNTISIKGTCTPNAVLKPNSKPPSMSCQYTGNYSISGSCICMQGFQKVNTSCEGIVFYICFTHLRGLKKIVSFSEGVSFCNRTSLKPNR